MSQKFKLTNPIVLLACLTFLCIAAGYTAVAATRMRPPTVVVTFNISEVLSELTEKADSETKLRTLISKIEDGFQERSKKIEALRVSIESAAEADKPILMEEFEQINLEGISYKRFAEMQVDNERSLMLRDMYIKIKEAVVVIAEENGYDMVLISDVERELTFSPNSQMPREAQVLEQIGFQRTIYTSSQIDITEQIVTHMNLEWEKHADR